MTDTMPTAQTAPTASDGYLSEVAAVSSKGQVVLPKSIREKLHIESGSKLMVISDGINILLKPITMPDIAEFRGLMDAAASWAADIGMTEEDLTSAIKAVRKRKAAKTNNTADDIS